MRINTQNSFLISGFFHLLFLTMIIFLPRPENLSKVEFSLNLDFIEGYNQTKNEEAAKAHFKNTMTEAKLNKHHKISDSKAITKDSSSVVTTSTTAHYKSHSDSQSHEVSSSIGVASVAMQSISESGKDKIRAGSQESLHKDGNDGDMSQILSYLIDKIEAIKKYPYLARRKGIEGDVVLLIDIDRGGNLVSAKVAKSSGHEIIDQSAEMLIKKVFPVKHNLNRELKLKVPITYRLLR